MATTTARNQQDVENMNVRDRLWDSLNYSYGKKREDSDKSFAKAYSQAVNQGIKTGMQRSSYGAQTLANIDKQKIDAQNDIYDQQIADYENRLYQIERDEKADQQWEAEFGETQKQNEWSRNFQQNEANRTQARWESEFGETQKQNEWNRNYQESRAAVADAQWEKEYQRALNEFNEQMAYQRERANVSDAQWEKEYQEKLRQFNEQMAENKRQFDLNMEYQQDEFKYKWGLAGGGSADTGSSSGGGGSTAYWDTRPEWQRAGYKSEAEWKAAQNANSSSSDEGFIGAVSGNDGKKSTWLGLGENPKFETKKKTNDEKKSTWLGLGTK